MIFVALHVPIADCWCAWQVEVNGRVVTVLKKGSYFGEIGLLRTCRRTASISAISETVDLFVLSKVPCPVPCDILPRTLQHNDLGQAHITVGVPSGVCGPQAVTGHLQKVSSSLRSWVYSATLLVI
jgi:hypothetical protein